MKASALFLLLLLFSFYSSAQYVSRWENHTDKRNIADFTVSGNHLWAATGGGAFGWNLTDSSFITLSKSNGLQSNILSAITTDNYGKIWMGSTNGVISVYDPSTGTLKPILDIYISERTNKGINELKVIGDTILAATDFGISLIDSRSYIFYDTYFRFGNFTSFIKVNNAFKKNIFYVAAQSGVAIQKQNAFNLSAPESWNVYRTAEGLPDNNVLGIASYKDSIICGTARGLSVFNGTDWMDFLPQFGNQISGIYTAAAGTPDEALCFIHNNVLYKYMNGTVSELFSSTYTVRKVKYDSNYGYFAGTGGGIAYLQNFNGSNYVFPDGPRTNQFTGLAVGNDGVLWAATGEIGVGTNRYNGVSWKNFNVNSYPGMISDALYTVYIAPDNTKYFGNWGRGLAIYNDEEFISYNASNSGLVGIITDPEFVVITGVNGDSRGNIWALNYGSAEKKSLSMLTPDRNWYHYSVEAENNIYIDQHFFLAVDFYDTKWYASAGTTRKGLFYFNENKTYDDPSDDISGFITSDNGLTSSSITSLAVDRRGDIWVGTALGLTIISNTGSVLSTPQLRYYSIYALRQQSINCIAVDPLNNKWIGTNQGLQYVNSDGSALLATFDTRNSPLLADEIRSLAIDPATGIVYVGTNAGLVSFNTSAVRPLNEFSELKVYPNPFRLNQGSQNVTIDGLIRDSDIKVLTISGKLINEFSSPGGRIASWDGKDLEGRPVATGVYIIVAFDKEGNNVATTKVAVLKE